MMFGDSLHIKISLTYDPRRWIFLPFQQSIRLSEGARKTGRLTETKKDRGGTWKQNE